MNRKELLGELEELMQLEPDSLTGAEKLDDLAEWDSLAVISFIALADEKFGIIVDGEALASAQTIDEVMGLVASKLAA